MPSGAFMVTARMKRNDKSEKGKRKNVYKSTFGEDEKKDSEILPCFGNHICQKVDNG